MEEYMKINPKYSKKETYYKRNENNKLTIDSAEK